jgi:PAS domain S-box-containing protein
MNDQSLRVLIVEDSEDDELIIIRELKKGGYNPVYERVETASAMKKALNQKQWDIILCDYTLPKFNAPSAIAVLKEANIDIPIIIVSGTIGEDVAAECMRLGAQDYIMKENLSRLCPAIARELEDAKVRSRQKQMEETLRKASLDWQITFDATSDAVCLLDADQRIVRCNRTMAEMLGIKREYLIGRRCWEIVHGTMDPIPGCPIERMKRSLVREKMDVQMADKWFSVTVDPILDEKRAIQGMVHILRDITGRKRAEEALRESEEKFAAAFHASPNLIAITRMADGKIVDVNDGYSKMLGYSRDESIGKTTAELSIWADSADRATFVGSLEKFGEISDFETAFRRKDGTVVTVLDSARTIELHGEKCLLSIAHDITARKRMEQLLENNEARLRTLVQTIPDLIWLKDIDGIYLACNKMFERFFGAREADIVGKTDYDFVNKDLADSFREHDRKAMAAGKPSSNEEWITFAEDGHRALLETIKTPMFNAQGKLTGVLGISRDITERKRAEELLRESEEKYRTILEGIEEGYFEVDFAGNFTFFNDSLRRYFDYSSEELMGMNYRQYTEKEHSKVLFQTFNKVYSTGELTEGFDWQIIKKDGTKRYVEASVSLRKDSSGNPIGFRGIARDITEHKKAEDELRESEMRYRGLFEHMSEGFAYCRMIFENGQPQDFIYLAVNNAFETLTGLRNVIGKKVSEIIPGIKETDPQLFVTYARVSLTGKPEKFEIFVEALKMWFSVSVYGYEKEHFIALFDVITDRKKAEEELGRLNHVLRMLSATNEALIHIPDEVPLLNEICRIAVEVGGYRMAWIGFVEQDKARTIRPVAHAGFDSGYIESANITWADNERGRGPGGTAIRTGQPSIARNILLDPAFALWRDAAIQRGYKSNIALPLISEGRPFGELAIYSVEEDDFDANEVEILKEMADDLAFGITALRTRVRQVQTDAALRESEERYRLIAENTADTIAIFDLNLNPTYISPSITKLRGYTVQEEMTKTLDQMLTPDSLQRAMKNFADQMALESSPTADPARTTLMELEEYCKDGSTVWVELAASFLRDNNLKPTGVLTVTRDITERKQAEKKLNETLSRLRKSIDTTIQSMVSAVEMRDPYTAGHQLRVANLARTIATEMGLAPDKIDGIRMAGSIHDIGKLSIPAEILSKPTKLTEIEFSLIKEHPQNGYEMLKDVESPWPLAQIVHQHHERMDGSGYPGKLKGDEILIEARIMAVADVVEAMASHRPYRPTLGIEVALEEIEKNKGILYDVDVANACLKLFREKGYQFK